MSNEERQSIVAEMIAEARRQEDVEIAEGYHITTIVPYPEKQPDVQTYKLPPQDMDKFFYDYSDAAEVVVDIRPITDSQAT